MTSSVSLPTIAVGSCGKPITRDNGIDIINMDFDRALKTLRKALKKQKENNKDELE